MKLKTFLLAGLAVVATSVLAVQGQVPSVNSTINSVFTLTYDNSTMKATYSASGQVTPAASTPGVICSITGSATKNIRVRRVIFVGTAVAVVSEPVAIYKYSSLPTTAGAGSLMTKVPYDSNSAAASAIADVWTTNPAGQNPVGALADVIYSFANYTTGIGSPPLVFTFGQLGSPVVLRGAAQMLGVSLEGINSTYGQAMCTFEWTEE